MNGHRGKHMDDLTYKELGEGIERHLRKARHMLREVERRTCNDAAEGDDIAAAANVDISLALGAVNNAKAYATRAGNRLPDVTVNFGGK